MTISEALIIRVKKDFFANQLPVKVSTVQAQRVLELLQVYFLAKKSFSELSQRSVGHARRGRVLPRTKKGTPRRAPLLALCRFIRFSGPW